MDMSRTARPVRRGARSRLILIAAMLLVIAVYVGVVSLYAADLSGADHRTVRTGDDGSELALVLKPRSIDPSQQEFSFRIEVETGSELVESGTGLNDTVRVEVRDTAEGNRTQTIVFGPDSLSSEVLTSTLSPERRLEAWPFDQYMAGLEFTVEHGDPAGALRPLAADLILWGGIPGWEIGVDEDQLSGSDESTFDMSVSIGRSFSTVAFAIVLTASLILMATIALLVSISVWRRKRQMELIFLGWIAGMLFAVPALRNFLPGQPPIGSWVDFLIVLWVVVSLIISLALLVFTWFSSPRSRPQGTENTPARTR